ncbi:MAG: hypothetical protein FGM37_11030, partial [Phycisphaerales bacterium]|nr:hypothetical protein [Phycisphaerales bacterium]
MSADSIGPGLLPAAVVQLAARIVRQCAEDTGPDAPSLTAVCALALHQLSQGHTRVDLSGSGRVLLAPRDAREGRERIEVGVPTSLREAVDLSLI